MNKTRILILLVIMLCASNLFSQTIKVTSENVASGTKEQYDVLKADKQVKQGKYECWSALGKSLLYEGYYKNNQRDSLWQYYYFGKLVESGYYKNGVRTGVWDADDYNGEPDIKYDYSNKLVLFYKPLARDSSAKFGVIIGTDTIKTVLDRTPIYLDGLGVFSSQLIHGLGYPKKAKENNVSGIVIISITIDTGGHATNYRVETGIGSGCDEEALKGVERATGDWLPGIFNGKPVTVEYKVPVSFTLQSY